MSHITYLPSRFSLWTDNDESQSNDKITFRKLIKRKRKFYHYNYLTNEIKTNC